MNEELQARKALLSSQLDDILDNPDFKPKQFSSNAEFWRLFKLQKQIKSEILGINATLKLYEDKV